MTDNIHRYLDGEVHRGEVPAAEHDALREVEEAIAAACGWVRSRPVPDLSSRVMAELGEIGYTQGEDGAKEPQSDRVRESLDKTRQSPTQKLAGALHWVLTPKSFSLRPAVAGMAAVIVAGLLVGRPGDQEGPIELPPLAVEQAPVEPAPKPVYIQFRLDTADASEVALAGTFTEWQPEYRLHESAPDVWTVTVPLQPGVHDYLFIVDGERWVPDPVATTVDDGFGGSNSRLLLSAPLPGA